MTFLDADNSPVEITEVYNMVANGGSLPRNIIPKPFPLATYTFVYLVTSTVTPKPAWEDSEYTITVNVEMISSYNMTRYNRIN